MKSCFACLSREVQGDMEDARAMREHSSRAEGISGSKWNEDDDDRETVKETFRMLDNDSNNTISIAEIESAASISNDLLEVANVLNAHCRKHNLAAVDEKLFADAIKTIPRARGHRVQWAMGLSLHNLLASFLQPGTIVDGLKGLKTMSENEVRSACENFAKDATELVVREWKALTTPQSTGSQGSGSNSKFSMEAQYGTLDDFYQGPEKRVGYPNPKVGEGMQIEHCEREKNHTGFITSNYHLYTKPSWEWCYLLQLHPPEGNEISPNLQTQKIPESLQTERNGQFPGIYQDFFWETTVECSFIKNADKLTADVKRQLEELKELLKTDEEKCRGIKIFYDEKLSIVFPLQLEEHDLGKRLKKILETSSLSMIDVKPAKRTYVEKKKKNATDQIQGRMPPADREKCQDCLKRMSDMKQKAGLRLVEVWALCLYTGPMFVLYNARLRGFPQKLINQNNKFETTIFVIISGIVKLSRISTIPKDRLLYRGTGGLGLPPAFRDDSAECTVKLAVTFSGQARELIQSTLEEESLAVIKQHLSTRIDVRQLVIAHAGQSSIWDVEVEVVVGKSRFDLLKSESETFNKSDIKKWNFHRDTDRIYFTKQEPKQESTPSIVAVVEPKQVATVESTPSVVAVVAAVFLTLKMKEVRSIRILDILKEKPEGFRGGVELGLMSTTSRKEIAMQYSTGNGSTRGIVFEIQAGRIDMGASLQCFSQYPGEEEFLIPPCSCVEVVNAPRIELKDGKEVVYYPVKVNVNLKCVTVEELQGRRKELHLAMFSNLIEEVFSQLNEKLGKNAASSGKEGNDDAMGETIKLEKNAESAGKDGNDDAMGEEQLKTIKGALEAVKEKHQKLEEADYLHDSKYLELFNEAMVEKRFADVKFDLYRKSRDESVLITLPDAIKKFPWEAIVGKSETLDLKDWAVKGWAVQDWSVMGFEKGSKIFLAKQLRFPVLNLVAAGVRVRFDPPNLSARSVRIRCEPQSLLNHVADRVAFLLSRYQSLCEVDIVERAAFESLTIESWRYIFEDCPRLSTVNGSFMPNRLLRPTRGAGAALMVGYCQARSAVSLDLTNLALGDDGLKLICPEMVKLGQLQYLFLDYNGLQGDCMEQFSKGISNLQKLKVLSLDGNLIESNGTKLLCDSLTSMASVEKLTVKGSVIPMDLLPEKLKLPANILAGKGIISGNKQLSLQASINSVAWSPDKSKIAAGGEDGKIVIFDAQTGEHIKELTGHTSGVKSVSWSPDGSKIASGSSDNTVIIWDAKTGKQKTQLKGNSDFDHSVLEGDQALNMDRTESVGCLASWCFTKKKTTSAVKGHTGGVTSVAWSPEGSEIASGSYDHKIIIWDAETGEQKSQLKGHTDLVHSVAWSPEGSMIASGSSDKTVIMWDAVTGDHHTQLRGHSSCVYSVAWSPDGSRIASGSEDKTIITWDVKGGARLNDYKGHSGHISCVAWNPNGDLVASASGDQTVSIWDTRANCIVSQSKGHTGSVNSVSWSYDGERIATGSSDKSVMIWNVKTGSKISELKGEAAAILSTAWNPHHADLVSCGLSNGGLVIWDTRSASKSSELKGHGGGVSCVVWNKIGEKIASGSWDGAVKVWEAKSGSCVAELQGHKTKVISVVWEEEEGKDATIISQAADRVSITWNARTGKQIRISERLPTS